MSVSLAKFFERFILSPKFVAIFQFACLLLLGSIVFYQIDKNELWSFLFNLRISDGLLSCFLIFLGAVVAAYRQVLVLQFVNIYVEKIVMLKIIFKSYFYGQFLPSSMGQDAVKIFLLKSIGINWGYISYVCYVCN